MKEEKRGDEEVEAPVGRGDGQPLLSPRDQQSQKGVASKLALHDCCVCLKPLGYAEPVLGIYSMAWEVDSCQAIQPLNCS
jgi:hypothetical protein